MDELLCLISGTIACHRRYQISPANVTIPEAEEARMAQAAESWRDVGVEVPEGEEKLDSFC